MPDIRSWYRFLSNRYQNLFLDYPVDLTPRYGFGSAPHPEIFALIALGKSRYKSLLDSFLVHADVLAQIPKSDSAPAGWNGPVWNNGFLPGLDIVSLFGMLMKIKPARYLEIGSGHSTRVARMAVEHGNLNTKICSIDPQPRAEIQHLADEVRRTPLEKANLNWADELLPGDVLYIDNSHRILPNSDSTVFFLEILPRLKPGVVVHIHDVFLPDDYPKEMCERGYSEQYPLAVALLANPRRYRPLFPAWFVSQEPEFQEMLDPFWAVPPFNQVERHGCSFWLSIGDSDQHNSSLTTPEVAS